MQNQLVVQKSYGADGGGGEFSKKCQTFLLEIFFFHFKNTPHTPNAFIWRSLTNKRLP